MPRVPAPCSEEACGRNFPICGKNTTYTNKSRKCRCDRCLEANREYRRRYYGWAPADKVAAWAEPLPCSQVNCVNFLICGKSGTYTNRGCRCSACSAAFETIRREWDARHRPDMQDYYRQYRDENRDVRREYDRSWIQNNRGRYRASKDQYRARKLAAVVIPFTPEQLAQKWAFWGNRCYLRLDGCTGAADQKEHVKPLSKGGSHMLSNLRPACQSCNLRKGNKWPFPI